ncbi:hypothetical protein [Microbacterium sp. USHLN272]|uniref:hypothetical protein n=1 Tax=Microbacterium sp. USHLN272 TaxID=3081287 RepID=UPI0030180079
MSEGIPLWSPAVLMAPDSAAHARFHVHGDADAVACAVEQIVIGGEHTDLQVDDSRRHLRFRTPRTIWSWELEVGVTSTPMRRGCEVLISLDVAPDRPFSPHDAEKNVAALEQIRRQIEAAIV